MAVESEMRLFLMDGATMEEHEDGHVSFQAPAGTFRPPLSMTKISPGLRWALKAIAAGGSTVADLVTQILGTDGPNGIGHLMQALERLNQSALVGRHCQVDGKLVATIEPRSNYFRYRDQRIDVERTYMLSRFAIIRNDRGEMTIESPLGHGVVRLHAPETLRALALLSTPRTIASVAAAVPEFDEGAATLFLSMLANAETLVEADETEPWPEDEDPNLGPWELHDLFFHTRSRLGRHNQAYGGVYPFRDKFPLLPVVKPPMEGDRVALAKPDLEALATSDTPFSAVLEARRSIRTYGDPPISADQLGEFLYRCYRIQKWTEEGGVSWRPSPGGGALHELEIYPLVVDCDGLAAGLYHYDPLQHELEKVREPGPILTTLARIGATAAEMEGLPQILFLVSARFQRIQLKYRSVGYAAMLKNLGCLYQTMYLVATAMGLAPCALGGGHSDLFAAAAGLDYLAETSIGEFLLGSRGE